MKIVLGLALHIFIAGCTYSPRSIVYVFPDNFRGPFVFQGNQPDGISVKQTNDVQTFAIPPSGVLKIKEKLPIRDRHTPWARYASGVPIPIVRISELRDNKPLGDDAIALRPVGNRSADEYWFVVGTFDDLVAAAKRLRGGEWARPNRGAQEGVTH